MPSGGGSILSFHLSVWSRTVSHGADAEGRAFGHSSGRWPLRGGVFWCQNFAGISSPILAPSSWAEISGRSCAGEPA